MRNINKVELFSSKKPLIGSWITLSHPGIAEIMVNAGFDWLAIDLEHSVISLQDAENLIRTIDLAGGIPLVRVTSNDADLIKRVMDAGSYGIVVPMVNSKTDAQKAVDSMHYPSNGSRGVGLARAQKYGADFYGYKSWQDTNAILIVQIEHIDAVNNLEDILSVNGVDGLIIGPYDLSGSLGKPGDFDSKEFITAIEKIKNIANKLNIPLGIHIIEPSLTELKMKINEGFRFIAYSLDIRMIDYCSRSAIESQ